MSQLFSGKDNGLFGFGGFGLSKMCFVALAIKVFA